MAGPAATTSGGRKWRGSVPTRAAQAAKRPSGPGVRKGEEVRTPFEDSGEVSEVDGEKGAAEGEADPEEDREDRSEDASIPRRPWLEAVP